MWNVLTFWWLGLVGCAGVLWTHSIVLDDNYVVHWTPGENHITFEVQVRTLGYVGFGFSPNGQMEGSDVVIGWVRDGEVFFKDRNAKGRFVPEVDASQDWDLLLGYENGTHTVLRFQRLYDTCDKKDYRITNDTMRIIYAYHNDDPYSDMQISYHGSLNRGSRSVYLVERVNQQESLPHDVQIWELRNPGVRLPDTEDYLYWCKIFKLPNINRKNHMIRYEPIHESDTGSGPYMHHVIIFECHGNDDEFEEHARDEGRSCYQPNMPPLFFNCNNVLVAWAIGSEGFTFPTNVGYPLDPKSGPLYYMMETHYDNPGQHAGVIDNSGIRIYYTPTLRENDAGILSVGMDPNWKHIIPPGQTEVVSAGHCISDCTSQAIPPTGINMFAAIMHTHLIGRKIRFRLVRNGEEQAPIAVDNNYDFNYQEYRRMRNPVKIYPGDHLIAECVYNSEGRTTITLGGLTTREEMCLIYGLYYPRIELSLCYSLPSLPTVLHSLGIQELWPGSNPVRIKSPQDIRNMTLETRLLTYDWENNFHSFQDTTHKGSFKPLCWIKSASLLPGTDDFEAYYPNITKPYREPSTCHNWSKKPRRKKKPGEDGDELDFEDEEDNVVGVERQEKTKVYISVHESSRLNQSDYNSSFRWRNSGVVVMISVSAILFLR